VRIASARFTRTEQLFKEGTATKSELEADSLSLKREQLGLEQIREDLRLLKKFDQPNMVRMLESNLQLAKDELERLKQRSANEIAQAEADLKTSQRALEILDETLTRQKRQLGNAKIFAPQDGLVAYSTSSPFQGRGEGGFEEARSRSHGGGFRSMGDPGGFQGFGGELGGRRGRRGGGSGGGGGSSSGGFGSQSSSSGSSGRSGGSSSAGSGGTGGSSSRASTAGAGASGSSAAPGGQSASMGVGMQGASAGGGFGGSSGGGRTGGGGFSSGGGGMGSGGASASFASYGSIRQSAQAGSSGSMGQSSGAGSSFSGSSGSGSSFGGSGSGSSFGSSSSGGAFGSSAYGVQNPYSTTARQSGSRFGSQSSSFDPSSFLFIGTSGVVEEGAMVLQRQELIRLPDVSKMLAEVRIHESRVRQVHPGMTAFVRVETLPGRRFKGTVRRVAILPDTQTSWVSPNTKVYTTDVLIDEELPELKPGVSARAQIIITNLIQVLSVPIQAVTTLNGEHVCYVKKGSGVTPVPVKTGWFNDRLIEVASGLKEGDLVLLAPTTDEEYLEPETPQSSASETASPGSSAPVPSSNPQPASEGRSGERRQLDSPPPAASSANSETGVQPRENLPADGSGPRGGGRGRRGPLDPEMQKRMEEFMKLSPEEREERMREFRARRGQGQGQAQPSSETQPHRESPKP
jgi:multidrug efflux pump subunit AcrA (membrane-fusion protein)